MEIVSVGVPAASIETIGCGRDSAYAMRRSGIRPPSAAPIHLSIKRLQGPEGALHFAGRARRKTVFGPTSARRSRESAQAQEPQNKQDDNDCTHNPDDSVHGLLPFACCVHSLVPLHGLRFSALANARLTSSAPCFARSLVLTARSSQAGPCSCIESISRSSLDVGQYDCDTVYGAGFRLFGLGSGTWPNNGNIRH